MTNLFIDHRTVEFDQSVQTWADLLQEIDDTLERQGRLVTEVQFDGVGEPTFREPDVLLRRLESVSRIEAWTATPHDLLRDCLLDAAGSVAGLSDEAVLLAERFRNPIEADTHHRLSQLASDLGQFVRLVDTLRGALQSASVQCDDPEVTTRATLDKLDGLVDVLLVAHRTTDFLTVADILEYELAPMLRGWQTGFERLAA